MLALAGRTDGRRDTRALPNKKKPRNLYDRGREVLLQMIHEIRFRTGRREGGRGQEEQKNNDTAR